MVLCAFDDEPTPVIAGAGGFAARNELQKTRPAETATIRRRFCIRRPVGLIDTMRTFDGRDKLNRRYGEQGGAIVKHENNFHNEAFTLCDSRQHLRVHNSFIALEPQNFTRGGGSKNSRSVVLKPTSTAVRSFTFLENSSRNRTCAQVRD